MVFLQISPYVINQTFNDNYFIKGSDIELLKTISKYYNFTNDLIDCNDLWGLPLGNGSWNGIIGQLMLKVNFIFTVEGQ